MMIAVYNPAKNYMLLRYSKASLQNCRHENEVISTLQKELQKQYYEEKIIDKNTYTSDFAGYEERNVELSNRITMLEERITRYRNSIEKLRQKIRVYLQAL